MLIDSESHRMHRINFKNENQLKHSNLVVKTVQSS